MKVITLDTKTLTTKVQEPTTLVATAEVQDPTTLVATASFEGLLVKSSDSWLLRYASYSEDLSTNTQLTDFHSFSLDKGFIETTALSDIIQTSISSHYDADYITFSESLSSHLSKVYADTTTTAEYIFMFSQDYFEDDYLCEAYVTTTYVEL